MNVSGFYCRLPCYPALFYLFALLICVSQQGVIVAGGEEYLIEPLVSPDNQTRTERGERTEGRPHVVYKRSSLRYQYKGRSCGVIGEKICILVLISKQGLAEKIFFLFLLRTWVENLLLFCLFWVYFHNTL